MLDREQELFIEDWQRMAARDSSPQWSGDLMDDCTSRWAGLCLRAEEMDRESWWWAVLDERTHVEVASSNNDEVRWTTGHAAREAAAAAASDFLGVG